MKSVISIGRRLTNVLYILIHCMLQLIFMLCNYLYKYVINFICDQVCENQPCQHTKTPTFFQPCCIITHVLVIEQDEYYTTDAEIHGESYKAYRMQISLLELKILLNI